MILPHAADPFALLVEAFAVRPDIGVEKLVKSVRLQHLPGDFLNDDVVQPIHADAQTLARYRALAHFAGATIVSVCTALAGVEHETGTAMAALRDAGEQRGAVDDARSDPLRTTALEQSLHGVEGLLVDDGWHLEGDPFGWRARPPVTAVVLVEVVLAVIGRGSQKPVHAAGREALSPPRDATLVEMGGDGLDAHGTAVGAGGEVEEEVDDACFLLVDNEHFLVPIAAPVHRLHAVTEGRARAVPEAFASVLQHRPVNMLGVLAAAMLIHDIEHLADELAVSILANILGDRDEFDIGLAQPPDVEFRVEAVAGETAERVDDDKIEGVVRPRCPIDHVLEGRSVVIERRSAGLGEYFHNLPATLLTEPTALGDLIRQRQVGLGLAAGTDANIDGGRRHTVSPVLFLIVEDGHDLFGKEGPKQGDFLAADEKVVGEIDIDNIAVGGTTAVRGTRTITRFDAGRFVQRLCFLAFMSETPLHP